MVRLIPLELAHAEALTKSSNVTRMTYRFTSNPVEVETTIQYIQMANYLFLKGLALPFAIEEKFSGEIVGSTGYLNLEYWDFPEAHNFRRPGNFPTVVEIGSTWFGEPAQNPELISDAKLCLLFHAFEVWEVLRVSFKTDAQNAKTRKNIERIGAKLEGVVRVNRQDFNNGVSDTAFYSILKSEWPKLKARFKSKFR